MQNIAREIVLWLRMTWPTRHQVISKHGIVLVEWNERILGKIQLHVKLWRFDMIIYVYVSKDIPFSNMVQRYDMHTSAFNICNLAVINLATKLAAI